MAIVVVLVALSALAAAIVRLGMGAQAATARDLMGTRASLAARAGIEWGLYQAFKGTWTACSGASQTLDLRGDHGLYVTVQCDSATYHEGESAPGVPRSVRVVTLDAVACPAAACPDASASALPGYVERRRVVHAVD